MDSTRMKRLWANDPEKRKKSGDVVRELQGSIISHMAKRGSGQDARDSVSIKKAMCLAVSARETWGSL